MKSLYKVLFIVLFVGSFIQAQTVYVTRTGSKYHNGSCSYLKSSIKTTLSQAVAEGYTPCSRCDPPTLNRSKEKASAKSYSSSSSESNYSKSKSQSYSGRCQATTKKGSQCKRNAKSGSSYCWQHGG